MNTSQYIVLTSILPGLAAHLAEGLRLGKDAIVLKDRKEETLKLSPTQLLVAEQKIEVGPGHLPFLEDLDKTLAKHSLVIDCGSWWPWQIEAVDQAFKLDGVVMLQPHPVVIVEWLRTMEDRELYRMLTGSQVEFLMKNYDMQKRVISEFSRLCWMAGLSDTIHQRLQKVLREKQVLMTPDDANLVHASGWLGELEVKGLQQRLGQVGDPKAIWDSWSDQQKSEFQSIVGMIPGGVQKTKAKSEATDAYRTGFTLTFNTVSVDDLHRRLGFREAIDYPQSSREKPFSAWRMENDDSPIFRYLYRNFRPSRHLEFGTWQGEGVRYALEESDATVWTLNLLGGEREDGKEVTYSYYPDEKAEIVAWAKELGVVAANHNYRTDSLGFIGRKYLQSGFGHRVCQIYSDSIQWDTSNYPEGFFDSVLIDGGHTCDVVLNDTRKALKLVRSGGLIMWHDVCPSMRGKGIPTVDGVIDGLESIWSELEPQLKDHFWINPSYIFVGIKR